MRYKNSRLLLIVLLVLYLLFFSVSAFSDQISYSLDYDFLQKNVDKKKMNYKLHNNRLYLPEFNVKGIYVTGWVAGIPKRMDRLINLVEETELNTMVIDVKDDLGYLSYKSSITQVREMRASENKIKDIRALLEKLDHKGIYTIARIVVFKDTVLVNKQPKLALKLNKTVPIEERGIDMIEDQKEGFTYNIENNLLKDKDIQIMQIVDPIRQTNSNESIDPNNFKNKIEKEITYKSETWTNPSHEKVWDYNIQIAREAFRLGFDEVQFDYIRFPVLRNDRNILLNKNSSKQEIINQFISTVKDRLDDINKPISIDVFGLTTSTKSDMGIGQNFAQLSKLVNTISPMVYPSHYSTGIYGLDEPERNPYETVYQSMIDARNKVSNDVKIRPWLQDFTLKYKYSTPEVKAQIRAVESLGIKEWLLWNPRSEYTIEALEND
jgi:hypothetical protein